MPQKYIGQTFAALDGESTSSFEISLIGSHLQNVCIEVEGDGVNVSVILSPGGARRLIAALQAALSEFDAKLEV